MSTNTHEPNASPAHGSDQANHVSGLRSRTCCTCSSYNPRLVDGCCPYCGHHFCGICSDEFDPLLTLHFAAQALPKPRNIPISATRSPPLPLPVTSESNQPQNLTGREERDQLERARNEVNREQEDEMRPRGETPKEQHSLPIPRRKKRKLNTEKCRRCRDDKKGCTWQQNPEKCDRCIEKGLQCSERTRVTRPRKHPSKHVSLVHNDTPPSTDSDIFEERFKKWAFLKSYDRMMAMATDRFERLEKGVKLIFGWPHLPCRKRPTERLTPMKIMRLVRHALGQALGEIMTTENSSEAFPVRSLTEGENLALIFGPPDTLCLNCHLPSLELTINKAIESLDICGAFLVQQHLFQEHWDLFQSIFNRSADDFWGRESERYTILSKEIPQQARAILKSFGLTEFGTYVRSTGLYHFDIREKDAIGWQLKSTDCLARTPLHRYLDFVFEENQRSIWSSGGLLDKDHIEMSWYNSQDILGRTPLHILCQFSSWDGYHKEVEGMLEAGANPGVETVYGSLPLHYVAVNGNFKFCEILMEHKSKFNIEATDTRGRTALDYAMIKKHDKVADLLMSHYKEAGLSREIEAALMIKEKVENGRRLF